MNKKEFVAILIITFFVIMVWIIAEIIHSKPSVPLDPKIQKLLDPLEKNFDSVTLEKIKNLNQIPTSPQATGPGDERDQ